MAEIKQPKIRFKGHINDWEQRKLGKVLDIHSGRDYKHLNIGNIPVHGTGGYMLSVDKALSYEEDAIGIGRKGTIDRPYILKAPFWTVDTLFYAIPRVIYDIEFIYSIFQKINWKAKDESTGVPSLSKTVINSISVNLPSSNEQQKIGAFFKQLDETIALHQQKLEVTKQFKQTMLKKMFPKNGETTPEIRFKGFTDDWKEEKLVNLIKLNKSQEVKRENLTNIRNGYYVLGMRTFSKDGYLDKSKDFWYNLPVEDNPDLFLNIGEFAMIDADMDSELSKIGKVLMNASDEKYLLNSHICKVSLKNENDYNYLFSVMSTPYTNKLLKKEANGSIAKGILNKDVYKQKVLVTEDKKEQELIGDFFYQLEKEIYLIEQKLETYKSFKKAMLQKMFI